MANKALLHKLSDRIVRTTSLDLFMIFALAAATCAGGEFMPLTVKPWGTEVDGHGMAALHDGNPTTFATLSVREKRLNLTFDLGAERETTGMRLVAQPSRWLGRLPAEVTVCAVDSIDGAHPRPLTPKCVSLPVVFCGDSAFVEWPKTKARYLRLDIHKTGATAINERSIFGRWLQKTHCDIWGHPYGGDDKYLDAVDIAEISLFDARPADFPVKTANGLAYPSSRLEKDWLMQDAGIDNFVSVFAPGADNTRALAVLEKVAKSVGRTLPPELKNLRPDDPALRAAYFKLCAERRKVRLASLAAKTPRFVYVKHFVFGSDSPHSSTVYQTDDLIDSRPKNWTKGGELCLLTIHPDGTVSNEVLLARPEGCIRDPALSPDGRMPVFSMRDSYNLNQYYVPHRFMTDYPDALPWDSYLAREGDDFHLWTMNLDTRELRQITFSPPARISREVKGVKLPGEILPCADTEPVWTGANKIVFESTRCESVVPCHQELYVNLYVCDPDGSHLRRVSFDGASSLYPQELDDGRIIYTRWEYNDRNARFQQTLFTMNWDGTKQEAYYGADSFFPSAIFHARQIPGSPKVIAIASGHHVNQKGKLITIDRRKGLNGDSALEFVSGSSMEEKPGCVASHYAVPELLTEKHVDAFGQIGAQWAHPWPLGETEWVTAFLPEGSLIDKWAADPQFGIYWQNAEGERELLAYDPMLGACQPVAVAPRRTAVPRVSSIKWNEAYGRFYVADIHVGEGLKGIPRGTVKKLRVVAIESRPAFLHKEDDSPWPKDCDPAINSLVSHPGDDGRGEVISAIGTWDVKHVLGEVDVNEDGSCYFECPANNGVYFQALDARGRTVQTMRSWVTVRPGEEASCVGCHEDKTQVFPGGYTRRPVSVQRLRPAPGQNPHPLLARLDKDGILGSVSNYLGVNAPRSDDPDAVVEGFSFVQRIQPILDAHCVKCHDGSEKAKARPDFTGKPVPEFKRGSRRRFSQSYLSLTQNGRQRKMLSWYSNAGRSAMLPPYAQGSAKSLIMNYLEPSHHGVLLKEEEKRLFACWIDLAVPFVGSYAEATDWSAEDRLIFNYHQNKRAVFAEDEIRSLK